MQKESFKTTFHRGIYTGDDGSLDYDFIRLAKKQKSLTFKTKYLDALYKPAWHETPFKEIRFTYPGERINPEYMYLLKKQETFTGTLSEFSQVMIEALKKYLRINLNEDDKYLMFHSGGYDSRIISACMRDLWNEGVRFDVHFRCHQPEESMFFEIMKREGWKKSMYSVYPGKKINYYDLCKVTMNGWHRFNQSMNFWSDIIPAEKEHEYIIITGLGGELFKYLAVHGNEQIPARSNNRYLDMILQHHPDEGQWEGMLMKRFKDYLMPKWSYFYIENSFRVDPAWCKFNGETDSIRLDMVKHFRYKIDSIPYGRHDYSWNLDDNFYRNMYKQFYSSRFYKDYGKYLLKNPVFSVLRRDMNSSLWSFMTVYDAIHS